MSLEVFFFSLVLAFFTHHAQARELTELTLDIASDKQGAEAKQEAFDKATQQATQQLTEEILGPERSARYWTTLEPKLLKNSTRYVLFVKGSAPETKAGVTHIQVSLKLSPDSLETLLREEGVLSSGGVKVLPLVEVVDEHGMHYAWWAGALEEEKPTSAQDLFKRFFAKLSSKFKAKNIYVLDPTNSSFRLSVPASYRAETLRHEDQMLLAQYLKADVVLSGKVMIGRQDGGLKLGYDLQMWQAKSGRQIGEVARADGLSSDAPKVIQATLEQTDAKVVDELSSRLGEAVASGNLNLNVVKLQVSGAMSYRQQAEFKRLLGQLREIKVLKERLFEPSRVIFEAETPVSGTELAKVVQKAKFPLYTVAVDGAQDDSLALSVRALSSASAQ